MHLLFRAGRAAEDLHGSYTRVSRLPCSTTICAHGSHIRAWLRRGRTLNDAQGGPVLALGVLVRVHGGIALQVDGSSVCSYNS